MSRTAISCALITTAVLLGGNASGEVSVDIEDGSFRAFIILGKISDDPSPWLAVRLHVDPTERLNAVGDDNGDGPPAFAMHSVTRLPWVVWAWNDGFDHEIALSHWDGTAWTAWEILTDNAAGDHDPAITFADDGTRLVVWWRDGEEVWYQERASAESSTVELVTQPIEDGSRPGLARFDEETWVAYQRQALGAHEVIVARRDQGWQKEVLASTVYEGPAGDGDIDVEVHARRDGQGAWRLWADWVSASGALSFRSYDAGAGAWSSALTEPYAWSAEAGETEREAREAARVRVLLRVMRQ